MLRGAITFALLLSLLGAAGARASNGLVPIGTFNQPIYLTSDPGDPSRLFVVERQGTIKLVENGVASPFADLTSLVRCCDGERGLVSIAIAPDFDQTGVFYVDYTGREAAGGEEGDIHVDAFTAVGNSVNLGTRKPMLTISHSFANYHNAGQLQIGPDGDLYISTGDGGGGGPEFPRFPQSLSSPLGKILRIHPDPAGPPPFYTVPPDNPFAGLPGDYGPIWSYGLRNPFRFSFDSQTGAMVIGDVGLTAEEEVDYAPMNEGVVGGRGANYGWDCREGSIAGPGSDLPPGECAAASFVDPVFDYPHTPDPDVVGGESRCAIIGGYVVRDQGLGDLDGRYLYGDVCSGAFRSLKLSSPAATDRSEAFGTAPFSPYHLYSFGEDSCGRVYVMAGTVYRLEGAKPDACGVLHVSVSDPAGGSISGTGIDCPGDCAEIYQLTQKVQLTPHPAAGFHLSGWQGADAAVCSGAGPCALQMDRDRILTADFEPDSPPIEPEVQPPLAPVGGIVPSLPPFASPAGSYSVALTASSHRVRVGHRVELRVEAAPCLAFLEQFAHLYRGGRAIATKMLDGNCETRFHPRVRRTATFKVKALGVDSENQTVLATPGS